MAGKRSRRVLEVRGVSLAALRNHPKLRPTTAKSCFTESKNSTLTCTSLSSMDDYELDVESNQEIQQMFVDIDSLLYEDTLPTEFKEDLLHECSAWKEKHAHYRILGRQILPETDSGFETLSVPSSENIKSDSVESPTPSEDDPLKLVVQGVHLELNSPSVCSLTSSTSESEIKSCVEEEIIAQDGNYEEIIAKDRPNTAEVENSILECSPKLNFVKTTQENVLKLLTSQVKKEITLYLHGLISQYVSHVKGKKIKSGGRYRNQLPLDVSDISSLRLSTAPSRSSLPNDVDGILTISSKNLQPRMEKGNSLPATASHNSLCNYTPTKKIQGAMRLMPIERNKKNVNDNIRMSNASILHQSSHIRPNILPPMHKTEELGRVQSVKPNIHRPSSFLLQGSHLIRRKLNENISKENNLNEN